MKNKELMDFLEENQVEVIIINGNTRLWKLGDHTRGIFPKKAAVQKLLDILTKSDFECGVDIVWDSMISVQAFSNDEDTVKIWKIGDSKRIIFSEQAFAKLKDIIQEQGIKGPNIIWDDMIETGYGVAI